MYFCDGTGTKVGAIDLNAHILHQDTGSSSGFSTLPMQLPVHVCGKAVGDNPGWAPATHVRDQDRVHGSWIHPPPKLVLEVAWGGGPVERKAISVCLSLSIYFFLSCPVKEILIYRRRSIYLPTYISL